MMFCIWFAITAFLCIAKIKKTPLLIILTLAVMLIFGSFGPWGAIDVSARSQRDRLAVILTEHNILVDGKIKHLDQKISRSVSQNISSIFDYMVRTNKQAYLQPWFVDSSCDSMLQNERSTKQILQCMGIEYIPYADVEYVNIVANQKLDVLNIKGYDYLIDFKASGNVTRDFLLGKNKLSIKLVGNLYTVQSDAIKEIFDLNLIIKQNLHNKGEAIVITRNSLKLIITYLNKGNDGSVKNIHSAVLVRESHH